MKRSYRWGILGAGRIAEKFCTALCFTEGAEVYAIASRDPGRARQYAGQFRATKWYDSYEALVKDDNVDIVYIATPHAFHFEQVMLCLDHHKPVLCEKPMSLNYVQTSAMIVRATEKELFLMEGIWTRFMPFLEKMLDLIRQDAIGIPLYVNADFGFAAPKNAEGRLFNSALGGGAVLDIGVYCIFLSTLLFGQPVAIQSFSQIGETGVDEYANMIMQFNEGTTAHLLASLVFSTALEVEVIGSKGRIKVHCPWYKATEFTLYPPGGQPEVFSFPHACNGFEYEIAEVMQCLDKGFLQSQKMTHALSLSISKTMDAVLLQAGVPR